MWKDARQRYLFVPLCCYLRSLVLCFWSTVEVALMLTRWWTILMCVTCKFSTRYCFRKPHSSSSLTLICATGVESCPHWWTPLHHKLQHSDYWPKWNTVGRANSWREQLISFYWNTTDAFTELYLLCHCQPWSQCHPANNNCWVERWVDAQCASKSVATGFWKYRQQTKMKSDLNQVFLNEIF